MTNLTELVVDSLKIGGATQHEDLPDTALISIKQGVVTLSKAGGAVTATIAKPTATTDDFKRLTVISLSAQAHTLAVTGGGSFGNGGAGENLATFDAAIGGTISLIAYQGEWNITGKFGVTVA